jgi:hypothetical protein
VLHCKAQCFPEQEGLVFLQQRQLVKGQPVAQRLQGKIGTAGYSAGLVDQAGERGLSRQWLGLRKMQSRHWLTWAVLKPVWLLLCSPRALLWLPDQSGTWQRASLQGTGQGERGGRGRGSL